MIKQWLDKLISLTGIWRSIVFSRYHYFKRKFNNQERNYTLQNYTLQTQDSFTSVWLLFGIRNNVIDDNITRALMKLKTIRDPQLALI